MDILKQSSNRLLPSLAGGRGIFLLLLSLISGSNAQILPFFNPLQYGANSFVLEAQGYVAEDPVSLREFFHDWHGDYHPRSGDNVALELIRGDVGVSWQNGWYTGYFYRLDAIVRANRGFVDGFHDIKNNVKFKQEKTYDLEIGINGIESHGITLGKSFDLVQNENHRLRLAVSAYGSYCVNSQDGELHGKGVLHTDESYSASGVADYFYTHNYLYDGRDIDHQYEGYGYGFNFSLLYEDLKYRNNIGLVVNDLFARVRWKHLPYSIVYVDTDNQRIEDGYVEYDPTISGWELYKDHTQKIDPRYDVWFSHGFEKGYTVKLGWQKLDFLDYPYATVVYSWNGQRVDATYEHRFHSISLGYANRYFYCSILSNGFEDLSAIGFSLGFNLRF